MSGIFDDFQVEPAGQALYPFYVPDLTAVMDGHDGRYCLAGVQRGANSPFRILDVQVEIVRATIDQQRLSAQVPDYFRGRGEGQCGNHDGVSSPNSDGF